MCVCAHVQLWVSSEIRVENTDAEVTLHFVISSELQLSINLTPDLGLVFALTDKLRRGNEGERFGIYTNA